MYSKHSKYFIYANRIIYSLLSHLDTSTCKSEHLYYSMNEKQTKNLTLNCPLTNGNPIDQSICWFLVNRSIVEFCDDFNNQSLTFYDLLKSTTKILSNNELFTDLTSITSLVSSNDEDNNLSNLNKDKTFFNSVLEALTNGEELQLLCWSINQAGQQQKPCNLHIAYSTKPTELIDCQIFNTKNHSLNSLNVECQYDKDNYWRIEKPITYQLDVIDDQTDTLLFQLVNNKQPTFELNELPPGKALRLTVFSSNRKGKSNNLSLRTTLNASKWRAGEFYLL